MRINSVTIPSEFIPLDDMVAEQDQFANVYAFRRLRLNHNVLLAQRIRKPLVTQIFEGGTYFTFKSRYPVSNNAGPLLIRLPIYVTQHTKKIHVELRAAKTELDGSSTLATHPVIYAGVHFPRVALQNIKTYSATVTAAFESFANYGIDINVPSTDIDDTNNFGRVGMELEIYVQCQVDTTYTLHSAFAITDVGSRWFVSSVPGTGHEDDIVYCTTNLSMQFRKIVKTVNLGGGSYKYFIDQPWSMVPDVTVDTLTIKELLGIHIQAISVYELPVTDYSEGYAL